MPTQDQPASCTEGAAGAELLSFLQSELLSLEENQGFQDAEARGLLQQLAQQTQLLHVLSTQHEAQDGPVLTDLQLAEQIDSLDAQLSQLEASLSSADEPTRRLLMQSTNRWLCPQQQEHQQPATPERSSAAREASAVNGTAAPNDVQQQTAADTRSSSDCRGGANSQPGQGLAGSAQQAASAGVEDQQQVSGVLDPGSALFADLNGR